MEQLFGAIPSVLRIVGSNAETDEAVVFAAWKRCAGSMVAERTLPLKFIESRLIVAVVDDLWRRNLEDLAPQMLPRINANLANGSVRFIEYRVEPKHFRKTAVVDESVVPEVLEKLPQSISDAANNIADLKLRARFVKTAAEYLAARKTS
jgi:hypothetical protein